MLDAGQMTSISEWTGMKINDTVRMVEDGDHWRNINVLQAN